MSPMTQVILIRRDGALMLYDSGPAADATVPGQVLALGGQQIDGLTPRGSAAEYLQSYTNLPHGSDQLVYWRRYPEAQTHIFLLHQVDGAQLRARWGNRLVVVRSPADAQKLNLTPALRRAVTDYYKERA